MKGKSVNIKTTLSVILAVVFLLAGTAVPLEPGNVEDLHKNKLATKAEKVMKSLIGTDIRVSLKSFEIPASVKTTIEDHVKQDFYRNSVLLWEVTRDGTPEAYGMMDDVLGKQMPITFLVLFDREGTITACRVLKYRERYGSGVRSKRWLRQFSKKNAGSGFSVGKDIDGISGATISSESVSRGIEKLAHLIAHILQAK
jgi:Na+-translocating ferredoxin:NAD+ oxidoreductase RnfG subunit